MAIRRFDIMVRDVRQRTGNVAYSPTTGVRMSEFERYGNDAQDTIFNKMLACHSSLYTDKLSISTVPGQAEYTIPDTVHSTANIGTVHYSFDGSEQSYTILDMRTPRAEIGVQAFPDSWFFRNGKIVLSPIPMQPGGKLRVNFQYNIPTLGIRRGLVSAHDAGSVTITLNNLLLQETRDDLNNGYVDYVSIVDKDGVQQATGLPVISWTDSTRVLVTTLTADQVTAVQNGASYLVFGKNATTHSPLIDICDRYLYYFMALNTQARDSNSEAAFTMEGLRDVEAEIIGSVSDLEEDIPAIPILDYDFLNYADGL